MPRTMIKISTQFESIHQYSDAPDEVAFLRHPHRHVFHVIAQIEVYHDDRELEFIIVKRDLERFIARRFNALQGASCEMVATTIYDYLGARWQKDHVRRQIIIEVNEDRENGAIYGDI